ncbi:MAG: hypothetical protein ABL971_16470 [Vicinamibacterales bacterium]
MTQVLRRHLHQQVRSKTRKGLASTGEHQRFGALDVDLDEIDALEAARGHQGVEGLGGHLDAK